jgi:flagellar biosynthesis protein FliR
LDNLCLPEFVNALHLPHQLFVLSVLLLRQMDDPATNTQTTTTTDATFTMLWFFVNSKLKSFIVQCVKSSLSTTPTEITFV